MERRILGREVPGWKKMFVVVRNIPPGLVGGELDSLVLFFGARGVLRRRGERVVVWNEYSS